MRAILHGLIALQLVLIVTKLCGVIGLDWVQVFYPFIAIVAPFVAAIVLALATLILFFVTAFFASISALLLVALFDFNYNISIKE